MTLFLNGGGCATQVRESYRLFEEVIDTNKPLLYVPLAMELTRYADCFNWITQELYDLHFPQIEMVTSPQELGIKNLNNYAAVFIGGGNTYKLLKELKACAAYQKIQDFLASDGVVFGGSAGAIIFGKSIDSCRHDDPNTVNLQDLTGFNQVFGAYIGAHYPSDKPEKEQKATQTFTELSFDSPVIALPEEDTLVLYQDGVRIVGSKDFYIFKEGQKYAYKPRGYSVAAFKKELKQPQQLKTLNIKSTPSKEMD